MNLKDLIAKMDEIESKSSLLEAVEHQFTPEQEKWLGGADRQDPYILNRMPGAKPPYTYFTDPADQALAQRMGFPAPEAPAASTPQPAQLDKAKQDATGAPAAVSQPVPDPSQGIEVSKLPASGAAAKPAAPTQLDSIKKMQQELGVAVDGKIGPNTRAAMQAKPEIAAKYAAQIKGAKQYPGTAPATSGVAGKPSAPAAQPAAATSAVPPELAALPSPRPGQEHWVKGTRYQYIPSGRGGAYEWRPNMQPGDWGWNWNQWAAKSGFTGSQDEVKAAYSQSKQPALAKNVQQAGAAAKPAAKESKIIAKELVESFGYKLED